MMRMNARRMLASVLAGVSVLTSAGLADPGDPRHIEFTLPADAAFKLARDENRLLFLKPIYGGVNQTGYADYRAGSW